jgi:hypothetical protein
MAKIDRLGWADGFAFTTYGVRVGVRANNSEVLSLLQERFPPGWKPVPSQTVERLYSFLAGGSGSRPGVRRFNLLYSDIFRISRTTDLDEAIETFESNLQLFVAEEARRRVFIHAGVVGWRGKAIVLPGRSYAGKTTLVAELVRAGATYYSDEYAVLDNQGRVHPYPRPLQIRGEGTNRQKQYGVETLGGRAGKKPLPVGLVIVSQYKRGAKWRPRQLSAGRAAMELLANAVSARRRPEVVLRTLGQVAAHAPVFKSARGEAKEVVDFILQQVGD